jgi:hypothetical protein
MYDRDVAPGIQGRHGLCRKPGLKASAAPSMTREIEILRNRKLARDHELAGALSVPDVGSMGGRSPAPAAPGATNGL